jgi:ApaG protein
MSTATTEGVRVMVETHYLADESTPLEQNYVFRYTVTIVNEGDATVQLRARHWVITDAQGKVEHVRGPGVVGAQPVLKPGQAFRYTSGCPLRTSHGEMRGSYHMVRDDGSEFDAEIATFHLVSPQAKFPN